MYGGRTTGVGEGKQTEVMVPGMQVWYQGRWQIGVERLLESEYSRLLLRLDVFEQQAKRSHLLACSSVGLRVALLTAYTLK